MRTLILLPTSILLDQFSQPSILTGTLFGFFVVVCIVLDVRDTAEWILCDKG